MNSSSSKLVRSLLPATALLLGAPVFTSLVHAQAIEAAVSDAKGDAAKVALKDLDAQIDQLDALIDNAPTAEEKVAAKARLDALKERRSELRKTYVQARYDSLKADVKTEANKLSAWSKRTFSTSPEAKLDRKLDKAVDHTRDAARDVEKSVAAAGASLNGASVNTSADIASYRNSPTDENKAEVKASLAGLDTEIDRLDQQADALPRGEQRDAAKLRVKALKERRGELSSDFRKARYDALKADVKAEWNKIVH